VCLWRSRAWDSRRSDTNDAIVYYNKGLVLGRLKRYKEALSAYEQAILPAPKNAFAYHWKGDALKQLGRQTEAQQAYEKAQQLRNEH